MSDAGLAVVVGAIGIPGAIKLARLHGGATLLVSADELRHALGPALADRLRDAIGAREISVSWSRKQLIPARDAAIVAAYHEHGNVSRIARENLIDRRMVRKVLRRAGIPLRRPMVPL